MRDPSWSGSDRDAPDRPDEDAQGQAGAETGAGPAAGPEGEDEMNAVTESFPIADAIPVHDARRLTEGGAQARILLNGQVYTLRITRAGKLILTK